MPVPAGINFPMITFSFRPISGSIFPLVAARAPSLVSYSILSGLKKGGSRGGRFGLYLTLEQLGFVIGSSVGGFLYAMGPVSVLGVTLVSFLALAGLSLLRIERLVPSQKQT